MQAPQRQFIFQMAILVIFGALGVVGIIGLATFESKNNVTIQVPITIWGPSFGKDAFLKVLQTIKEENKSFERVRYVEKHPARLYSDLLEAVATGNSPDLVLLDSANLLSLRNKLYPVSFETLPKNLYRDTYIQGAEIFMLEDAIYAYPMFVDPLVLYWNRDLFASAAIAQVPKDWDMVVNYVPRLSKIEGVSDLRQSAIAFGEYDNVLHAKEILSSLIMQTGSSIVSAKKGGSSASRFTFAQDIYVSDADRHTELALNFYTSFSNPTKTVYSWNKTFQRSREAFGANMVAMYGGFVSEQEVLTEVNANLDFGMAVWPQSNNNHASVTYGNFYGVGVMRASKNPQIAMYVAQLFASPRFARIITEETGLPSVRRDILSEIDETDPYSNVKTQSAIIAEGWLEPAPEPVVDESFRDAINGVVAGTLSPRDAIANLGGDIATLLKEFNYQQ